MQSAGYSRDEAGDVSYAHSLQFYDIPPQHEVSLEDFEQMAVDRVKCKRV
jgi:hypothetical protein